MDMEDQAEKEGGKDPLVRILRWRKLLGPPVSVLLEKAPKGPVSRDPADDEDDEQLQLYLGKLKSRRLGETSVKEGETTGETVDYWKDS